MQYFHLASKFIGVFAWLCAFFLLACTPDEEVLTTNANSVLRFSEDAVVFDTVFTSIGSATQRLKVYNPDKRAVAIDEILIGGNETSPYSVLVNGLPPENAQNLRLLGGDSLTVLVTVNINPRDSTLPFVVYDSLLFRTNGNLQDVKLLAWGQDAHFIRAADLSADCNRTWTAGKPYVLVDSLVVPPACTFTLEAGTRVYAYNNAALRIAGTLNVQGTPKQPVTFTSFRQERPYRELPGQWQGITFRSTSRNNRIHGAVIQNATNGIEVQPANDAANPPDVQIASTTIKNMSGFGVSAFLANVTLTNTLLTNCGGGLFSGQGGGNYSFTHCTLANYNQDYYQGAPALQLFNTNSTYSLSLRMQNTVVWGSLPDEAVIQADSENGVTADITYCVLKTTRQTTAFEAIGNQLYAKPEPLFANPETLSLQPDSLSPLINAGIPTEIKTDLMGQPRDSLPDIGAYEYVR